MKIVGNLGNIQDEAAYYWPLYKSILFHLLVWSVNNSENNRQVCVDIELFENDAAGF